MNKTVADFSYLIVKMIAAAVAKQLRHDLKLIMPDVFFFTIKI